MKTGYWVIIGLVVIGLYIMRDTPPGPSNPNVKYNPDNIAFDWENNRVITKQMADTMIYSGGKWLGPSQIPKPPKERPKKKKPVTWLRPYGKYSSSSSRDNGPAERAWLEQQARDNETLTEDDIRDIIREEVELNKDR